MIASNTTQLFISRTARLRARLRRVDPYTAGSITALLLTVLFGTIREAVIAPAAPSAIVVFATPPLRQGSGMPELRSGVARHAPAAMRPVPTLVPTAAPVPAEPQVAAEPLFTVQSAPEPTAAGYTAHTTEGDLFVPDNATPVPAGVPYDGPFLAPAASAQPPAAPRLCTGFGDSRDYDPMYASSPACHGVTP